MVVVARGVVVDGGAVELVDVLVVDEDDVDVDEDVVVVDVVGVVVLDVVDVVDVVVVGAAVEVVVDVVDVVVVVGGTVGEGVVGGFVGAAVGFWVHCTVREAVMGNSNDRLTLLGLLTSCQ